MCRCKHSLVSSHIVSESVDVNFKKYFSVAQAHKNTGGAFWRVSCDDCDAGRENPTQKFRPHSFWDFSVRGIPGMSIPNSTYSSSNGTEIILFHNKSPKFIQTYHHYSSYSCSSSYSTVSGGIDGIDEILFHFFLFPKKCCIPFTISLFRLFLFPKIIERNAVLVSYKVSPQTFFTGAQQQSNPSFRASRWKVHCLCFDVLSILSFAERNLWKDRGAF